MEELSTYSRKHIDYEKYPKLFLSLAASNLRVLFGFPMHVASFFCAAAMLPESKVQSFHVGYTDLLEPKRWWKYLIGAACKLDRKVASQDAEYEDLFTADELEIFNR